MLLILELNIPASLTSALLIFGLLAALKVGSLAQQTISRCHFVAATLTVCGHLSDKPHYCHVVLLTCIDVAVMFFAKVLRVIDVVATLFLNEKLLVFTTFFPHSFACNATYFPRSSHVFLNREKTVPPRFCHVF